MSAYLNGNLVWERVLNAEDDIPGNGFVAFGTKTFGLAQFDDFAVDTL